MKKAIVFLCAPLVLFLTGCPEPRVVSRSVLLTFPIPEKQTNVILSVDDAEVQEALKFIDGVLVSNGFVRDQNPDNASAQGFVASYSRVTNEGFRRLGDLPQIYFRGDRLGIIFSEGRNPNGRLSETTKKSVDLLQKELSRHYGDTRVRVIKR